MNRKKIVGAVTTACLATLYGGCSAAGGGAGQESLGTSQEALLGTITFDSTCTTAPSPQTNPPAIPANVTRHLKISEAYARIVANSPAFRECLQSVMASPTTLGVPPNTWTSGPYYACDGDPATTLDGVMSNVLSSNGTLIRCDYSTIGTNTGGYANVPGIDASGREVLTFGNELGNLSAPENCNFNPDNLPCVGDDSYGFGAAVLAHEIMHTHGYTHVSDSVWNLNNVNVGDVVGTAPDTHALTLGDFCGVMPDPTPGNNGVAPTAPSSTPTPGRHPTYGSGIPYEVDQCLSTVLGWSEASGHLHDDCGANFAGLRLVDSVLSGSPATATTSCVSDPYSGDAYGSTGTRAPVPPHAPSCTVAASCDVLGPMTLTCAENANPIHLERRATNSTGGWQRAGSSFVAGFDYRVCAESLYGKACTSVGVTVPTACPPSRPRFKPIPWWLWQPLTATPAAKSKVAQRLRGGTIMALPVPASVAKDYTWLGAPSGDLSSSFGALGVGLYNPQLGLFSALGPSKGAMPPMIGSALATVVGVDGLPHLVAFGGETDKGVPLATIYDGAVTIDDNGDSTSWTSSPMPSPADPKSPGPGARTHASVVADAAGNAVYLFGGRSMQALSADLWSYDVTLGTWTKIASNFATPRADAAIALDGSSFVVFGGKDASGNLLGDLSVFDLASGKLQVFKTKATPRAGAAIAVYDGRVFLYGGQSAGGASDALDVLTLADGTTVSSSHVNVAAVAGSSLGVDDAGLLTIVPGSVPKATLPGGAFVGLPGQLTFVGE